MHIASELRICVKAEVYVGSGGGGGGGEGGRGGRRRGRGPNKLRVSVDVKQHFNNKNTA